jgi:hypothetical protein
MDPVTSTVGAALGKTILKQASKSAGQRLADATFGPKHERALQKVIEQSLAIAVDAQVPEEATKEQRVHVRAVLEESLNAALGTEIISARTDSERTRALQILISKLRDPSLRTDIDSMGTLGVKIIELLDEFLKQLPAELLEESQRDSSPLFKYFALQELAAIREHMVKVAEAVRAIPASAPDQDRIRVLGAEGWAKTLQELYPDYPLLVFAGNTNPVCVFPAKKEERSNLESALGALDGETLPAHDAYSDDFDAAARAEFEYHLKTAKARRKWNGPTYALKCMSFPDGKTRIDSKPGRYFQSLATSEACDMELMVALSSQPDESIPLSSLPRRSWVHQKAANPVLDGSGRSAALSVATVILTATRKGGYAALLTPRSGEVATHKFFNHVAPSGILSPLDVDLVSLHEEFSVRRNILREYLEELYSVEEYEVGTKPSHEIESEPEILRLQGLIESGQANLYYTGVSVNLLTLRPEICTLLLVRDPAWITREPVEAEKSGRPWRLAWEWLPREEEHQLPSGRRHHQFLMLDKSLEPLRSDDPTLLPTALLPNAAAAIDLALRTAREVLL